MALQKELQPDTGRPLNLLSSWDQHVCRCGTPPLYSRPARSSGHCSHTWNRDRLQAANPPAGFGRRSSFGQFSAIANRRPNSPGCHAFAKVFALFREALPKAAA